MNHKQTRSTPKRPFHAVAELTEALSWMSHGTSPSDLCALERWTVCNVAKDEGAPLASEVLPRNSPNHHDRAQNGQPLSRAPGSPGGK